MRNRKILVFGSLFLVAIFVIAIVMNGIKDITNMSSNAPASPPGPSDVFEPQFVKEGTLSFLAAATSDTLSTIDIEIADDDAQRMQGLMYRKSMKENQGMLFIFDYSTQQSFWMKNTIISLDILYVDENFNIVTIHTNTQPYSESQLPSFKNAKYVVEVNAGYCSRHNIKEGDKIFSPVFQPVKIQV